MAKRRLTDQQQRRIASQQQRSNRKIAQIDSSEEGLGEPREGLVITRYSTQAEVLAADFHAGDLPCRCHIRANITDLVTGDRVIWRPGSGIGIIESVLPRATLMSRPDNRGQLRPVAANVDQIAIVFAPEPQPHQNLIDRYLVAVEHLGIAPLLVCNKVDILPGANRSLQELLDLYRHLGYPVLSVSANSGIGIEAMQAALRHHTTVLVGQSGVGKSSLLNAIHPAADAITGTLSQVAKGRHTTTATRFYALPGGGSLIDSPGIREFGLWHMEREQIARGFIEFRPYLGTCKFRDCRHVNETACAILDGVRDGVIRRERLLSYHQIIHDFGKGASPQ